MGRQLSLNIGGATVDTAKLGSMKFAKGVDELDGQDFNKGDDIIVTTRCRVLGAKAIDVYDAHGNIKETIKTFVLRADDLIECKVDTPAAYKAPQESEDDAIQEKARRDAETAAANGSPAAGEKPAGEPEPEPAGRPELASV